jgi:hypothetical protein
LFILGAPGVVRAGSIPVDDSWQTFSWAHGPNVFNTEGPLTFTSPLPVRLDVTDAFLDGDRFVVLDFKTVLGTTSVPVDDSTYLASPDDAFASPKFSHGTFFLPAGDHSLTLETIEVPSDYPTGAAFLRVAAIQAPEPSSLALAALGVAGLAGRLALRRRPRQGGEQGACAPCCDQVNKFEAIGALPQSPSDVATHKLAAGNRGRPEAKRWNRSASP